MNRLVFVMLWILVVVALDVPIQAEIVIARGLGPGYEISFSRDKRTWSDSVPAAEDGTRIDIANGVYYLRITTPEGKVFAFPNQFELEPRKELVLSVEQRVQSETVIVNGRRLTKTPIVTVIICRFKFDIDRGQAGAKLGITVREPNDEDGPVISQIDDGSAASRGGLRVGDTVIEVGGSQTTDVETLVDSIKATGNPVEVIVDRKSMITIR